MAFFPTEGDGLLSNLPNIFVANNPLEGVLTPEQNKELRNRAMTQGLIGTALNYLAQPKTENYGSAVPYLAKAYLGGMGASQNVYDAATKNLLDRLNLEKTARATELQGMTELDKLIATRDKIAAVNPNDPKLKIYDEAIKTKSTRGDGLSINLGQPITAINPKTGKEELVQFPNRPGEAPIFTGIQKPETEQKLKPIPPASANAYIQNQNTISNIDKAIAEVEKADESSFGLRNMAGDAVMQRLDPKGVKARAAVSGVGGQKFHDLSGAAVSITEANRLKPYIPLTTDTKSNVLEKLNNLKLEYGNTNDLIQNTFSQDQGYKPLNIKSTPQVQPQSTKPSSNVPKAGDIISGYKFKGGNPADQNNWEKM